MSLLFLHLNRGAVVEQVNSRWVCKLLINLYFVVIYFKHIYTLGKDKLLKPFIIRCNEVYFLLNIITVLFLHIGLLELAFVLPHYSWQQMVDRACSQPGKGDHCKGDWAQDSRRILSNITDCDYDTTYLQENPQRLEWGSWRDSLYYIHPSVLGLAGLELN